MGAPKKWSNEQIADALRKSKGMPSVAARRLGCSLSTVLRAVENVDFVRAAKEEAIAAMADTLEETLFRMAVGVPAGNKKIKIETTDDDGNPVIRWYEVPDYAIPPHVPALLFLSRMHPAMRARGYTERHEVTGAEGAPITIGIVKMDLDEL
jgi:hypothetical protein